MFFSEDWFLPAEMTDRPQNQVLEEPAGDDQIETNTNTVDIIPISEQPSTSSCVALKKLPSECRPFPKAKRASQQAVSSRKRMKPATGYLTLTPQTEKKKPVGLARGNAKVKRRVIDASSSESEDGNEPISLGSDSEEPESECEDEQVPEFLTR